MGSGKWGYKSRNTGLGFRVIGPNIGYNDSYPTYDPTCNYP